MKGKVLASALLMSTSIAFAETNPSQDSAGISGTPAQVGLSKVYAVGPNGDKMEVFAVSSEGSLFPMRLIRSGNGANSYAIKAFVGDEVFSIQSFSTNSPNANYQLKGHDMPQS